MYKLIDYFSVYNTNTTRVPKKTPNYFGYLNSKIYYNLNSIKEQFRFENIYVTRPNIFISLLNDIMLVLTDDPYDIYEAVVDSSIYFANNYDFTSTKNKGQPHRDTIFSNVDEFFLLEEASEVNILDFEDNWREYESIKVIATDNTDIIFTHPYKYDLMLANYVVYKVDLIALSLQYYYWRKEQDEAGNDVDFSLFLYQVAFPNILNSFLELSLANFMLTIKDKEDITVTYDRVNSDVLNIDNAIYKVTSSWKKILSKERYKDYYDFTKKFYPMHRSLYEMNKIITVVDNENEWLYLLSILTTLPYYIDNIRKDKMFTEKLKITIKEFKRKNIRLNTVSKFYLYNLISVVEEKIS